jgi:hypothetical protein
MLSVPSVTFPRGLLCAVQALLTEEPRAESVKAITMCNFLVLAKADLDNLLVRLLMCAAL